MAELADVRAAMQRAVDNAALSGAAAYSRNSAAFNALAIQTATTGFCNATATLPAGAFLVAKGGAQTCGSALGPVVTAVTDSYITGTPGVSHASGVSCTGTYLPAAPYNCGFIVTVSASASLHPILPFLFGSLSTVSVTGMAANPFISFAKIFTFPNGMGGSAKYANSIWAYALSMNAAGGVDYSSNSGALPDNSACTDDPDEVACGAYVMLGSTMYDLKGTGYTTTVNGVTTTYDAGDRQEPCFADADHLPRPRSALPSRASPAVITFNIVRQAFTATTWLREPWAATRCFTNTPRTGASTLTPT